MPALAGKRAKYTDLYELPENRIGEIIVTGKPPAVVLEKDKARRQSVLANLLASYLDRDIVDFFRVEKIQEFRSFLQLLAAQTGSLVNGLLSSRPTAPGRLQSLRLMQRVRSCATASRSCSCPRKGCAFLQGDCCFRRSLLPRRLVRRPGRPAHPCRSPHGSPPWPWSRKERAGVPAPSSPQGRGGLLPLAADSAAEGTAPCRMSTVH